MRILRAILVLFAVLAAIAGVVAVAARFSDGPIGMFPGGPLIEGEFMAENVENWSFAESIPDIELQLYDPDRSRRVWIVVRDGHGYIPCGLPSVTWLKQWPYQAMEDPRALVRIDGRRYAVDLRRVEDPAMISELERILASKYATDFDDEVWFFEMVDAAED